MVVAVLERGDDVALELGQRVLQLAEVLVQPPVQQRPEASEVGQDWVGASGAAVGSAATGAGSVPCRWASMWSMTAW